MGSDWFAIYDFLAGRWTWPEYMTHAQASSELLGRQFRKPMHVPDPVLGRWRPETGWEYQPRFGGPYVALR